MKRRVAPRSTRYARVKRSAMLLLREPKARFIGRSPASFFMHRRCASFPKRKALLSQCFSFWRRHPDLNWGIRVLQTRALPLGYVANWSGRRGSNSLPPPWQGGALPDELHPQMATPNGLEPSTSSVTGWRANRLHHRAVFGGNNRARTCDPLLVRQMLSQLSYAPIRMLVYHTKFIFINQSFPRHLTNLC